MLNLSRSRIKSLPPSIGRLHSLECLDLSFASFWRLLPEEIGNLKKLKSLKLRSTVIRFLPPSIGRLKSLEDLDFSCVSLLCKNLPDEIGDLKNLKKLDLSCSNFESLPDSFEKLTSLQHLNLFRIRIENLPWGLQGEFDNHRQNPGRFLRRTFLSRISRTARTSPIRTFRRSTIKDRNKFVHALLQKLPSLESFGEEMETRYWPIGLEFKLIYYRAGLQLIMGTKRECCLQQLAPKLWPLALAKIHGIIFQSKKEVGIEEEAVGAAAEEEQQTEMTTDDSLESSSDENKSREEYVQQAEAIHWFLLRRRESFVAFLADRRARGVT